MSTYNDVDWMTLSDNGDLSGNGRLTTSGVSAHTGRTQRSATATMTTTGNATATLHIVQSAAALFITIDHIELNNSEVSTIAAAGGTYYIVGYANVDFLTISETSNGYTDLNDSNPAGIAWTNGITITVDGVDHTCSLETTISYGTDAQYTFKIPFVAEANVDKEVRRIEATISDDSSPATTAAVAIEQEAAV